MEDSKLHQPEWSHDLRIPEQSLPPQHIDNQEVEELPHTVSDERHHK